MATRELVIIGSGMAAIRLIETLRRRGDRRSIILSGSEKSLPYNRILLSPLLAGEIDWQQLISHPTEWYEQHDVALRLGQPAVALDRAARSVTFADGSSLAYDQLVIATGSRPAMPPLPGIDLPGVAGFRNVDDVSRLQQAAGEFRHAVVLGGGLLGLEAAVALAERGMATTLVHRAPQLMNRQLDSVSANYLRRAIEARGVRVITGDAPAALLGGERVESVRLASGAVLPAELVVVATGIEPETALARAAGLAVNRGIVVDEALRSSDQHIFAIGECCELEGETVGLVAPIWQQVEVLAANLCGESRRFEKQPSVTMLKVSGVDVHVMGNTEPGPDTRVLTFQDRGRGICKRLFVRGEEVAGAILFGDVADSPLFFNLIRNRTAVAGDNCRLLLAGQTPDAERLATA